MREKTYFYDTKDKASLAFQLHIKELNQVIPKDITWRLKFIEHESKFIIECVYINKQKDVEIIEHHGRLAVDPIANNSRSIIYFETADNDIIVIQLWKSFIIKYDLNTVDVSLKIPKSVWDYLDAKAKLLTDERAP